MRIVWPLTVFILLPGVAQAYSADVGQVSVIEDTTGAIHDTAGLSGPDKLCREAAKVFYQCHPDDYDVLVVFTAKPVVTFEDIIRNVQQGTPVRNSIHGIGYTDWDFGASYGSEKRLEQCVSMASLGSVPDDPDGPALVLFGFPLGLTGIELLGHELGHRWLMGVAFDKGDGNGPQDFIRGWEDGANLHYSAWADSRSVMYGNFITDNGDGTFTSCGGDRKYNELDQYLMGLRAPHEVSPLMVLSDGSGQGDSSAASPKGTCGTINASNGYTRVDVSVDDVIRAEGPRIPAAADARHDWKIAFILVTEQGKDATTAEIAKVEAYRTRFNAWFPWATDNRGTVDTTLGARSCTAADGGTDADGGVVTPDGGKPPEDGGAGTDGGNAADAGGGPVDAGATDAGTAGLDDGGAADAGTIDAGTSPDGGGCPGGACDAGTGADGGGPTDKQSGCSCQTGTRGSAGQGVLLLLALGLVALRRPRRPIAR